MPLKFSTDEKRNFTIIEGPNGAGKTNLLNAVTWCLYGKELHLNQKSKIDDIVNATALTELGRNKRATISVTMRLGNDSPEYEIEQSMSVYKDEKAHCVWTNPKQTIMVLVNRDWIKHPQPTVWLNRALPEGVNGFFFFDGEKLDEFFKRESASKVKEALMDVSQITLLTKARNHLVAIQKEIRERASGISSEADKLSKQIDTDTETLELLKKSRDELISKKQKKEDRKKEINVELSGMPKGELQRLQEQRQELENEIGLLDEELGENIQELTDVIVENGPFIYSYDAISDTANEVEKKYKRGELPPNFQETYLRDLLKGGKCICGQDISTEGTHKHAIEKLLRDTGFSNLLDTEITKGRFNIETMKKSKDVFLTKTKQLGTAIKRLEDLTKSKRGTLKEISARIQKFEEKNIQELEEERVKLEGDIDSLTEEIGSAKEKVKAVGEELEKLVRQYQKELSKSERRKVFTRQLKLCENSIRILDEVKNGLIEDTKNIIESKTKKYFMGLLWKKKAFVDLKIDSSYVVSVKHRAGFDALDKLSAGERQLLALSFMAALKEVSGFDMPVVIDTPLGRISKKPKDNIAESLPKYLEGEQVTMLVTDQEYTDSVRNKMKSRIGKEWHLDYNEEDMCTEVKPL